MVRAMQGAALVAIGGCTIPPRSFRLAKVTAREIRVPLADYPELERPGGIVRIITPHHRAIFVRRDGADTASALSGVCTHQDCVVSPKRNGFRCACHGSTFSADGANKGGPAKLPLVQFKAEVAADAIVVRL